MSFRMFWFQRVTFGCREITSMIPKILELTVLFLMALLRAGYSGGLRHLKILDLFGKDDLKLSTMGLMAVLLFSIRIHFFVCKFHSFWAIFCEGFIRSTSNARSLDCGCVNHGGKIGCRDLHRSLPQFCFRAVVRHDTSILLLYFQQSEANFLLVLMVQLLDKIGKRKPIVKR